MSHHGPPTTPAQREGAPVAPPVPKTRDSGPKTAAAHCLNCTAEHQGTAAGFVAVIARETKVCALCDRVVHAAECPNATAAARHELQHAWQCPHCANHSVRSQVVILKDGMIAGQPLVTTHGAGEAETKAVAHIARCAADSPSCSPIVFRTGQCGHILCVSCLAAAYERLFSPIVRAAPAARDAALRAAALEFRPDVDGYLVPPCVLCAALGVFPPGTFRLETLRAMSRTTFSALKDAATVAFALQAERGAHQQQQSQLAAAALRDS